MSERDLSFAEPFALLQPAEPEACEGCALAKSEKRIAKSAVPKVALSPAEEATARARLAIIQPLIDFELDQAAAPHGQLHLDLVLVLPNGRKVKSPTTMVQYLAHAHQISQSTIWHWRDGYRTAGLFGLARQQRADKGLSRFFVEHRDAATLVAYLYLEQRQSVMTAYEALQRDCLNVGVSPRDLPSYSTVYAYLTGNAFSEPMKLLARHGAKVYRERCAPYLSRTRTNVTAGEIWVSDHMLHDVEVQNDCFLDAEWGAPIRLRFTAFADFRSNYFLGYAWAWEGSSRSIVTALRRGVLQYGPPESIYCDNGKDYLKVAKGAMPAYLRESGPANWWESEYRSLDEVGVFARMGIAVQHCIVRHPQSKHVERLFGTVHSGLDKKFPTYTGGSPATRPDFTAAAMAEHRKLLRMGQPGMSLHPPASQFIRMAIAWIEEIYHNKPQDSKDMEGMSPRQAFTAFRNPNQKPAPAPEVLALMLAERERRAVRECSVMLQKRRYVGNDEIDAAELHQQNDREVTVAYDPLDLEKVAILDDNNRLIAWAKPEQYVTQSAESGPAIAESMQQRRRLEKHTAGTIVAIAAAARANGAMTEAEHLAARAGVLDVSDAVTQRRARLRPDNTAVAPLSAAEIARRVRQGRG
jgi:putative transposase